MVLSWTAPSAGGKTAAAYDLRTSNAPLGADTTGWWGAAAPVSGLPAPAAPGTPERFRLQGLAPGRRVYVALRAQGPDGVWGPVTVLSPLDPPGTPLLQGVTPVRVEAGGPRNFVLHGLDLVGPGSVVFRGPDGNGVLAAIIADPGDGTLTVRADLGAVGNGVYGAWVTGNTGEDRLAGTVEVAVSPAAPDTLAPAPVDGLTATAGAVGTVRLAWTAPADPYPGGTRSAAAYDLRRLAPASGGWSWDAGTPVSAPAPGAPGSAQAVTVTGLPAGSTQAFAIVAVDSAGNRSPLSATVEVTLPAPDIWDPNPVTDLAPTVLDSTTVRLAWTAPLDTTAGGTGPAAVYDLRWMAGPPEAFDPAAATPLGTPVPGRPGSAVELTVGGLPSGTECSFALRSEDRAGNWSPWSGPVSAVLPLPPDRVPPDAVADLGATLAADGTVTLSWTAPADDRGPVAGYAGWRWDGEPASLTIDTGIDLADPPAPAGAGAPQVWIAGTVEAGTRATFAVVGVDPAGNRAPLSNPVTVDRTGEDTVPPAAPADFSVSVFRNDTVQLRWLAPGDDDLLGRADHYELVHAPGAAAGVSWWEGVEPEVLKGAPKWPGKQEFVNVSGVDLTRTAGFALRAVDEAGLVSPWVTLIYIPAPAGGSAALTASLPAPDTVMVAAGSGGVNLDWPAVYAPEAAGYCVYRSRPGWGRTMVAMLGAGSLHYLDADPPTGTVRYSVATFDAEGNESALAPWSTVTVGAPSGAVNVEPAGAGWRISVDETGSDLTRGFRAPPGVEVFDVQGRRVASVEAHPAGGGWDAHWDGRDSAGRTVSRGVYFVRVRDAAWAAVKKVVLRR